MQKVKKVEGTVGIIQTAVLTKRTPTHIRNLTKIGRFFGARKINGEWCIPVESVQSYIEECRQRAEQKLAA
jgi:hypothetical protein